MSHIQAIELAWDLRVRIFILEPRGNSVALDGKPDRIYNKVSGGCLRLVKIVHSEEATPDTNHTTDRIRVSP